MRVSGSAGTTGLTLQAVCARPALVHTVSSGATGFSGSPVATIRACLCTDTSDTWRLTAPFGTVGPRSITTGNACLPVGPIAATLPAIAGHPIDTRSAGLGRARLA